MKKLFAFIGLLGVTYVLAVQHGLLGGRSLTSGRPQVMAVDASGRGGDVAGRCDGQALDNAYRNHQRRIEVCGRGVVDRVLKDDLQGSRHQRFIVRQPAGQTLLIAYNIDLAPRIEGLRAGAPVEFAGEYEWNPQGGIVHWTHRDPAGRHPDGWIRFDERLYR
jgi:Protein of unknown function (DUF3465)